MNFFSLPVVKVFCSGIVLPSRPDNFGRNLSIRRAHKKTISVEVRRKKTCVFSLL
ncbi:MAG: hypothetical protein E7283_01960 [Lachnospiraceae bacterium]|nr:hypothetical protein [Lachnospiraceae bacterium]